ncbi:hypothetical protein HOD20_00655 [archaeon]|nr:hypothetical protein [archaeon]
MEKYKKNAIIGLLIIIFILVIVFSNKSKNIEIEEKTLEDRELEEKTSLKTDDADADDTLAADLTLNNINYPSGKTCQEKFDGFYFENIFKWNGESELDTRNGYGDPNPVRDNLGDFPSFGLLKKNTEVYSDLDDNEIKIFKNIEIDGTCWILAEVQNEPGESPDMWFKEEQFCNYMNLKKDDEFVEITGCSDEDEVIDCFVEGNVDKICVKEETMDAQMM